MHKSTCSMGLTCTSGSWCTREGLGLGSFMDFRFYSGVAYIGFRAEGAPKIRPPGMFFL